MNRLHFLDKQIYLRKKMLTLTKKLRREQESKDDQSRATDAFESNNNEVLAAQQRVKRVSVRDRLLVKEVRFNILV